MQDQIITLYVVCDDYLKAMQYRDDPQSTMTTAEVMTTALVATRCFKNCLEPARVSPTWPAASGSARRTLRQTQGRPGQGAAVPAEAAGGVVRQAIINMERQ